MALDPKDKKNIDEARLYIQDTLLTIGSKISESIRESIQDAVDGVDAKVTEKLGKDLARSFSTLAKFSDDTANNTFKINQGLIKSSDITKQINNLEQKRLSLERLKNLAQLQGLKFNEEDYQAAQDSLKVQRELLDIERQKVEVIENASGLAGSSAEALSGILGKFGAGGLAERLGINDAVQQSKQYALSLTDGGNKAATLGDKFKVAGNLAKNLGGNLLKSLGPLSLIVIAVDQLIDAFKLVDSAAGDTAKELGVSYSSALGLVNSMTDVATASNDIMLNTGNLVKSQGTLNSMFGTAVQFSGQMVEEFTSVQERLGLSAETMETFTKMGLVNGKSLKTNLDVVNKTVLAYNAQNKTGFSFKQIQESIGKTSKAISLTLGNNPEKLTKAVLEAKKLGIELNDLNKTADSLLNFEDSISSELEAELLTGRELNLERARAAALTGDSVKLGEEVNRLVKEAGPDFQKNVLAQEAVAKTLGISKEELADMVTQQKALESVKSAGFRSVEAAQEEYNRLVKEGASQAELDAKFKDKALQSQLQSVSQQQRMEAIVTRLKEVFVSLIEPLMPVLDVIQDIFEGIVKPLMQVVGPLVKELSSGLLEAFSPIKEIFTSLKGLMEDIFGKSTDMSKVFSGIGKVLGTLLTVVFVPLKAAISFVVQGIKSAIDIVGGFVDIFQGNFGEGLAKIAKGVIGFILRPFQFLVDIVQGTLNAVIKGINKILPEGSEINTLDINLADTVTGLLPMAKGGIVTGPTKALVGEAGPEAVVPLREFYAKMDELIQAVKQGQNIYIGPNKLNESIGLNLHSVG